MFDVLHEAVSAVAVMLLEKAYGDVGAVVAYALHVREHVVKHKAETDCTLTPLKA